MYDYVGLCGVEYGYIGLGHYVWLCRTVWPRVWLCRDKYDFVGSCKALCKVTWSAYV